MITSPTACYQQHTQLQKQPYIGTEAMYLNPTIRIKLVLDQLKIIIFRRCNLTHTETTESNRDKVKLLLPQLFQNNLLCAGVEIGAQGSCHGDSGGPLMVKNFVTKQWTQIATVQGGIGNYLFRSVLVQTFCLYASVKFYSLVKFNNSFQDK